MVISINATAAQPESGRNEKGDERCVSCNLYVYAAYLGGEFVFMFIMFTMMMMMMMM